MAHPFSTTADFQPTFLHKEGLSLSHSSRETLASCARKLEFRKFFRHSKRTDSEAGDIGKCLHVGVQSYLKTRDEKEAAASLLLSYPIKYHLKPMQARSLEACYSTLQAAINHQDLGRYQLAFINFDGEERPAVEVPFLIHINQSLSKYCPNEPTIAITYRGFVDAIFYDALTDSYIVLDIKTTRSNRADYTCMYKFSDQCLPYAMILERILGKPVKRLEILYYVLYIDALEPRALFYEFTKTEQDIQDWGRGIALDIRNLQLFYSTRWFPRRGAACSSWNRVCTHFDYCDMRNVEDIEQRLALSNEVETKDIEFNPWFEMNLELAA